MSMLSLSEPNISQADKQAVLDTLDSGWLTMGERVKEFESNFAKLHNHERAVAVNSCTSGLHLALAALGVGEGDEVLVPSLTFVASVNVIKYVGATPVFVDVDSVLEPHISLAKAASAISDKTKAVVIMHYGGYLSDVKAWRTFCDRHDLHLIEDAAHSPACDGVAEFGDVTAFSFFSNKNMTTAEGGMLLARDASVLDRLSNLRAHGMTSATLDRHKGHAYTYDVIGLGYNYRMDEIRAALGNSQLQNLLTWNQARVRYSKLYRQLLQDSGAGLEIPFANDAVTVGHLMPVLLPSELNRETVMSRLREQGIQTSIHYPPAHKFSYYKELYPSLSLPVTEDYCARELSLPLHPSLLESDIELVSETLIAVCKN